jgi:protoporphyrin/coproporphyrin ferrochelatase
VSNEIENSDRTGVLLLNLGGPEKMEDVRPFLFNLFSDPDIIRLPFKALQKPLAWLISTARSRKSRGYYRQIGGGSPLRRITDEQARALESELAGRGIEAGVYVGMRYWHPFLEDAFAKIVEDRVDNLIVLPLYPQFSISTTGSSLNRIQDLVHENGGRVPRMSVIRSWHEDENYVTELAVMIEEEAAGFSDLGDDGFHIVFSAHSVPVRYIEEGDPYLEQTRRTVEMVMERVAASRPHHLSFQSKVGPVEWLRPSTDEIIRTLAGQGVRQMLLVPISFVSEHIETLYELDILYRKTAEEAGLVEYRRVSALNCRPAFIRALADLVQEQLSE